MLVWNLSKLDLNTELTKIDLIPFHHRWMYVSRLSIIWHNISVNTRQSAIFSLAKDVLEKLQQFPSLPQTPRDIHDITYMENMKNESCFHIYSMSAA